MTELDRTAARRRCEIATAGKWHRCGNEVLRDADSTGICVLGAGVRSSESPPFACFENWEANGDFIAHARTDLPAALDLLDEKDAEIERLRKCIEPGTAAAVVDGLFRVAEKLGRSLLLSDSPLDWLVGKVEQLKREVKHFARAAAWYCTNRPGTPSPEWCHLGWSQGRPIFDYDATDLAEADQWAEENQIP